MAPLKPLNHWMLHDKKLAEEFDATLCLSPYYDPVRLVETQTDLTFFAPLTTDINSRVGNYAADFQRNSTGLYRAPMQSDFLIAGDDVARHEYIEGEYVGVLMEQVGTNKCENHVDNADVGLAGMTLSGNAEATLSVVDDATEISAIGLQNIVDSGRVYLLDNRSGTGTAVVSIDGAVVNLNPHTLSVYWRSPEGGNARLRLTNAELAAVTPPVGYERYRATLTPGTTGDVLQITAHSPMRIYFIVNVLEEGFTLSSPILSQGATATRSPDTLTWPLVDSLGREIVNDLEGMAALEFIPGFNANELPLGENQTKIILDFDPVGSNGETLAYQNNDAGLETFRAYAGVGGVPNVSLQNSLTKDQVYLLLLRWANGASEYQVGYKSKGVVAWGSPVAFSGWNVQAVLRLCSLFDGGAYDAMGPANARNLRIWRVDNGTAWLEDFYSGVAN